MAAGELNHVSDEEAHYCEVGKEARGPLEEMLQTFGSTVRLKIRLFWHAVLLDLFMFMFDCSILGGGGE